MNTFRIDYDKIDVEAIMAQIRQRVKEKKGVVYSEEELENLSSMELAPATPPKRDSKNRLTSFPGKEDLAREMEEKLEQLKDYLHDISLTHLSLKAPKIGADFVVSDAVKREYGITGGERSELPPGDNLGDLKRTLGSMEGEDLEKLRNDRELVNYIIDQTERGEGWNISLNNHDLIRSHPGLKGKVIESLRKVNRKFFKLTLNMDVLVHQIQRQSVLNEFFAREIQNSVSTNEFTNLMNRLDERHDQYFTVVKDISGAHNALVDDLGRTTEKLTEIISDLKKDLTSTQNDLRQATNDLSRDTYNQGEEIKQLRYTVENLRGLVEGQRQQIDYMLMRQRTLEKLAVLKEDEDEEVKKSSDLEKGRYKPAGEKGK